MSEGRILLVEDDGPSRLAACRALLKAGFDVVTAEDGARGWQEFSTGHLPEPFDLVISDVMMPGLDGLELLERVRDVDAELPLILLTALGDRATLRDALRLRVNEYLEKPINPVEELVPVARTLVQSHRERQASRDALQGLRALHAQAVNSHCDRCGNIAVRGQAPRAAGGDAFRCWHTSDGRALWVLADVSGHEVISSLAMASFLGVVGTLVESCPTPQRLLEQLNQHMVSNSAAFNGNFVCVTVVQREVGGGGLRVALAGCPPALLLSGVNGVVRAVGSPGTELEFAL